MTQKQPPSAIKWLLLIVLTVIWGSSFVLMKEGLTAYSPLEVAGMRMCFAAATLILIVARHFKKIPSSKWKWIFLSGMVGNCLPAYLFTLAETRVTSTTAGMLNSLSPVFTLIIGWLVFRNSPRPMQALGVLVGMVGASALIYFQPGNTGVQADPYAFYVVLACIGYGMSVNVIRHHLIGFSAVYAAGFALLFAALPYFIFFFINGFWIQLATHTIVLRPFAAIAVLGVVGSAVATILFNLLVKTSSALFAASVTYLMPVVSLALGLAYGEEVHLLQLAGLAVILAGVYLISLKAKPAV